MKHDSHTTTDAAHPFADDPRADMFEWVFNTPKNARPVLDEMSALRSIERYLRDVPADVEMVTPEKVRKAIFRDSFVYAEDWMAALDRFASMNDLYTIGGWRLVPIPTGNRRAFIRVARLEVIEKAFSALLQRSNAAHAAAVAA